MQSVLDNRRRTSLAVIGLAANCVVEAGSVVFYTLLLLSLDGVSLLNSRDLEGPRRVVVDLLAGVTERSLRQVRR